MNYIGVFIPLLSAVLLLLAVFIFVLTRPLPSVRFAGIEVSSYIKTLHRKLLAIFAPEQRLIARAAYLTGSIPYLTLAVSVTGLCLYLFLLYSVDMNTVSAVLYTSEDMSLGQKMSAVFLDPAGALLFSFLYLAFLNVLLHEYLRKQNLKSEILTVFVSIFLLMFIVPALFMDEFQPFRIYEQTMKTGEGLSRNMLENFEFTGYLFAYIGHVGIIFWLFLKSLETAVKDKFFLNGIKIPLLAVSVLSLGLSVLLDYYFRIKFSSEIFSVSDAAVFISASAAFSSGVYLLFSESDIIPPSKNNLIFRVVMAASSLLVFTNFLFNSDLLFLFIYASAFIGILYISIRKVHLFRRSNPNASDPGNLDRGLTFVIITVFVLQIFLLAGKICENTGNSMCLSGEDRYFIFSRASFAAYLAFFIYYAALAVILLRSLQEKINIKIKAVLTALLISVSAVIIMLYLYSLQNVFSDILSAAILILFPVISIFSLVFIFFQLLYNSRKFAVPGRMGSNLTYIFREFFQNTGLYASGILIVSILMILTSAGSLFLNRSETYTFQYYLNQLPEENSDYIFYTSEDKFFHDGYEISSGDVYVAPFFHDGASPKNMSHLIIAREIQLNVHVPRQDRTAGDDSAHMPLYFNSSEDILDLNEVSLDFPRGRITAYQKFYPELDSSTGEIVRQEKSRGSRRIESGISGIRNGVIDGLRFNIINFDTKNGLDLNHLFEYYYYYTNRGREFYTEVFPRNISVEFSVRSLNWFGLYYISFLLFLLSSVLFLIIGYRAMEKK